MALGQALEDECHTGLLGLMELLLLEVVCSEGLDCGRQRGNGTDGGLRLGLGLSLQLGLEGTELLLYVVDSIDVGSHVVQNLVGIRVGILGHFSQGSEGEEFLVGGWIGWVHVEGGWIGGVNWAGQGLCRVCNVRNGQGYQTGKDSFIAD